MLHSKVYYMEHPDGTASAFIGSHNITSFALTGLNGEASVLLEGSANEAAFNSVRKHIRAAQNQAACYSPGLKEAFAWWTREFLGGMRAEIGLPHDWDFVRTILIFATPEDNVFPYKDGQFYFELPADIEHIESFRTEVHLYLFDSLPATPWDALNRAREAHAAFTCKVLGADNGRGNLEVVANWRIEGSTTPKLKAVPSGTFRPSTKVGMQQVRAEVVSTSVCPFEYRFDREKKDWQPEFDKDAILFPDGTDDETFQLRGMQAGRRHLEKGWNLVKGLIPLEGFSKEKDEAALKLAAPESGSFLLVALRRRRRDRPQGEN
jgi:hypothetical protein